MIKNSLLNFAPDISNHYAIISLRKPESSITYSELEKQIMVFESLFSKIINKNDIIVLYFENELDFFPVFFALNNLSIHCAIIDKNSGLSRLNSAIHSLNARFIISSVDKIPGLSDVEWININNKPIIHQSPIASIDTQGFLNEEGAVILFTSGSSGNPKGIIYSKNQITLSAQNIINSCRLDLLPHQTELLIAPISHSDGWQRAIATLINNGTLILFDGPFNIQLFLKAFQDYHISSLFLPSPLITLFLKISCQETLHINQYLKSVELGTTFISKANFQKLIEKFSSTDFYYHYGLTECSRATTLHLNKNSTKWNTVGRPNLGVIITIDESSRIKLQANHRPRKYIINSKFIESDEDWLLTEDIGEIDVDNFVILKGRCDDRLSIGGHNIFPAEIKNMLTNLKTIADFDIKVNKGEVLGDHVLILIVAEKNEIILKEIKKNLPTFLHSSIRFVTNINRNHSGKIILID